MAAGRVLVVEDEEIVRDSMVRVLQRSGLDAEGVASGEEALARLRDRRYDILLADIRMPGMGGLELLDRARGVDPEVGAMVITGYGTLRNAMDAVELGVQGFVLKPVAPEDLVERVKRGLGQVRSRREVYRLRALRPLLEIGSGPGSPGGLPQRLADAARAAGEDCGAQHVSIHLLDDREVLHLAASWGTPLDVGGMEVGWGESPQERVLRLGERLMLERGKPTAGTELWEPGLQAIGVAQALYLPIAVRGGTMGVLTLLKGPESPPFSEGDGAFLSLACSMLALAMVDARL